VLLICIKLGGDGGRNDMEIGDVRIVRLVLLVCEGLLVTAAVMVTAFPMGATEGAVNNVMAPSAV
jgi:hypothetical protein